MIVKGKSETYQTTTIKGLKQLAKTTDLSNPAQVELTIAKMKRKIKIINPNKTQLWIDGDKPVSDTWRQKLVVCYSIYCKVHGIEWKDRPKYRAEPRAIQPPTQEQIETLIAAAKDG